MTPEAAAKVVLRPLITEKTFELVDGARICFVVERSANKSEISEAVEVLYKTKVSKVNTARTIYGKKAFVMMESVEKARDLASDIGML